MGSDYQSIYKQHIHENLLLRERNKSLENSKFTKLKELNNVETKFRDRYKKYMDKARKPVRTTVTRHQSPGRPQSEVSPRPHFIICKDLPYSFKTWGNLTDVTHEREGLDVYRTEVLDTDEAEYSGNRRRSATVATSDLATRITEFRNKRKADDNVKSNKLLLRRRSKSFCTLLNREQMPGNVINKSESSECVTSRSESMYQLPALSSSTGHMSLAALLRCPEKIDRSTVPRIVLTTETGENIYLDDNRRQSYNMVTDRSRRLDLYLRRRKSVCVAQQYRNPTSSTEALKAEVGLTRLLRTSTHLGTSAEYIDNIDLEAGNRNYLEESFEDLKKCRYIRKTGDESAYTGQLPTVQSLVMPPIQQRSNKIRQT